MATQSDNKIGNQWHSSLDGKFISGPNGENIGKQELTLANFGLGEEIDLDELSKMVNLEQEELSLDDFDDSDELSLDDFDDEVGEGENENFDEIVNMSEEQYDLIYNQGRTIPAFDTMAEVVQNLDSFFTDELIQKELKNVKLSGVYGSFYVKNTQCTSGLAFDFITKARSAKVHFKGVSDEEFMEKLSTMPQKDTIIENWLDKNRYDLYSEDIQDMFDVFLKNGQTAYIPTWHGVSGVQSHREYRTVLCQYKDDVKGAADTVLIGNGCYDYACYSAFSKGYSYSGYNTGHDGLLTRLLLPIDKNTKVCIDDVNGYNIISGVPQNWRTKRSILQEYRQYLPTIQNYVRNKLTKAGIAYSVVNAFVNSLDISRNSNNNSVPLALLGFDYVIGGTDQIDIINPSKVLINIEKYRADDD